MQRQKCKMLWRRINASVASERQDRRLGKGRSWPFGWFGSSLPANHQPNTPSLLMNIFRPSQESRKWNVTKKNVRTNPLRDGLLMVLSPPKWFGISLLFSPQRISSDAKKSWINDVNQSRDRSWFSEKLWGGGQTRRRVIEDSRDDWLVLGMSGKCFGKQRRIWGRGQPGLGWRGVDWWSGPQIEFKRSSVLGLVCRSTPAKWEATATFLHHTQHTYNQQNTTYSDIHQLNHTKLWNTKPNNTIPNHTAHFDIQFKSNYCIDVHESLISSTKGYFWPSFNSIWKENWLVLVFVTKRMGILAKHQPL